MGTEKDEKIKKLIEEASGGTKRFSKIFEVYEEVDAFRNKVSLKKQEMKEKIKDGLLDLVN